MKLNREMTIVVYMQAIKLKRSQASSTDIFRAYLINCCMICAHNYLNHFFNLYLMEDFY